MSTLLQRIQKEHVQAVEKFFAESSAQLEQLANYCAEQMKAGHKLLFCGNGGSACDAMHIAGEFVGRFVDDRPGLAAIALSADAGIITAVANDYAYDYIFARQVEALGHKGDILIALSTSGKSPNIRKAIVAAKERGIRTVLFTGEKGRNNEVNADVLMAVPSEITAHVQETHMVALHGLAGLIEEKLFCDAK